MKTSCQNTFYKSTGCGIFGGFKWKLLFGENLELDVLYNYVIRYPLTAINNEILQKLKMRYFFFS